MFGRKGSSPPKDLAVAPVEALFNRTATYREFTHPMQSNEPLATTHALWICACVTMDDAPIWLVYEDGDQGMVWCRVPDRVDISDGVDADVIAGGHADPGQVLAWLQGEASDPWAGGGDGSRGKVLDRFYRGLSRS